MLIFLLAQCIAKISTTADQK